MKRRFRHLFRPEYGDRVTVSPRRWWSKRDRVSARLAAKVLDASLGEYPDTPIGQLTGLQDMANEARMAEVRTRAAAFGLFDTAFLDSDGNYIDPTSIQPSIEARRVTPAATKGQVKSVHCGVCGSPFGDRTKPRNACPDCERSQDSSQAKVGETR